MGPLSVAAFTGILPWSFKEPFRGSPCRGKGGVTGPTVFGIYWPTSLVVSVFKGPSLSGRPAPLQQVLFPCCDSNIHLKKVDVYSAICTMFKWCFLCILYTFDKCTVSEYYRMCGATPPPVDTLRQSWVRVRWHGSRTTQPHLWTEKEGVSEHD